MKKPTNAELTAQLVTTINERDAALELADKHIDRSNEIQSYLDDAQRRIKAMRSGHAK